MPTFEYATEIQAPAALLFALTQDYTRRLEWDPFLRVATLMDGATAPAVGVRAWCAAWFGLGMETTYVRYAPPDSTAVRMTGKLWFLKHFGGTWRFEAITPERTRVRLIYGLQGRPRWLEPLLILVFARDIRQRLLALKVAVESGRFTNYAG